MLATSVASQISAPEMFYAGSIIQSRTYRDFEVYTVIAVVYLGLAATPSLALQRNSPIAIPTDDPESRLDRPVLPRLRDEVDRRSDRCLRSLAGHRSALLIASVGSQSGRASRALAQMYVGLVQGIPLLAWLFVFFFGFPIFGDRRAGVACRDRCLLRLRVGVPWRNLAWRPDLDPEDPVGSIGFHRAVPLRAAPLRDHPAGGTNRDSTDGRLHRAT